MIALDLRRRLRTAQPAIREDQELSAAASGLDVKLCFKGSNGSATLAVPSGELVESSLDRVDITMSAPDVVWCKILAEYPPPGYQSVTALQRCVEEFAIEGAPLLLAQCLHAIERILEILRGDPPGNTAAAIAVRDPSLIHGRYADVTNSSGQSARLYYERSGEGPPILMLHTAGADSRQYHDLMSDREIASRWSLYAFDLPSHGRSFPIRGEEAVPWRLSEENYASWCVAFIARVIGDRPIVIGCSMGAAIAVVLAARFASYIKAIVALEAPDRSPGRRNPYLRHAMINQTQYAPSYVRGLMSPQSPADMRRRACWIYGQGGFGVYDADLRFYSEEYDGMKLASSVDTRKVPAHFLTGEYDYSASPASTKRLSDAIEGSVFVRMKGLGHFPMTENPDAFRAYLLPVLADLGQ